MSGVLITPARVGNFSFTSFPGQRPTQAIPISVSGPPGPAGKPGPAGPKGDAGNAGAGASLAWVAGETVGSPRVVMLDAGFAKLFVQNQEASMLIPFAVSQNSALANGIINVTTLGEFNSPGSFIIGTTYFAGPSGSLVTTPPLSGILLKVGTAKSTSVLEISFGEPIFQG